MCIYAHYINTRLNLLGYINTYLFFFDIVSKLPGPSTTKLVLGCEPPAPILGTGLGKCGGTCPSVVHLKRHAGKRPTQRGASSDHLL